VLLFSWLPYDLSTMFLWTIASYIDLMDSAGHDLGGELMLVPLGVALAQAAYRNVRQFLLVVNRL
jgi:hypothetical protein